MIKSLQNVTSTQMIWSIYFAYFQSRLRYGIMVWGGEQKSVQIFQLQKKVIWLITGVHKRESCRHVFRIFQTLTLASLYILEVLWFLKKYQGNLKQNLGTHGHNKRNKTELHNTAVPFYIREVWQTWALNYLIYYQYKWNNLTIIKVLREKWKLFSCIIHFIQLKSFYTLREFSITHCVGIIITNCTCVHILPLFWYNNLVKFTFVPW